MRRIEDFQQQSWLDRLRRDFNYRYAYGYDDKDKEDVFAGLVADVLVRKLPQVPLDQLRDPPGYVLGMFRNRAIDYFRHYHKRHQPPTALSELDEPYPQIFYEFCLGKLKPDAIAAKLRLALQEVSFWVEWLQQEKRCPNTLKPLSLEELGGPEALADIPEFLPHQELSSVEESYREAVHATLARWILGETGSAGTTDQATPAAGAASPGSPAEADRSLRQLVLGWLNRLTSLPPLPLEADDRLMLKMLYLDDCTIAEAGQVLGMANHQVTYRRDKVLETTRAYMKRHGIEFDGRA